MHASLQPTGRWRMSRRNEVMNVILPIVEKQIPGGVPSNGIQWEDIMHNTKIAFFNIWKKGEKRYESMDEPDPK